MTPALVVFPHPDDEVFFCVTLRRLSASADAPRLVYVTAGGFAPLGRRVRWLRRSLAALELTRAAPEVLGFPDGGCVNLMGEIKDALAQRILDLRPRRVYTVAYEGGHPDHDACHWAVVEAAKSSDWGLDVLEFPTYRRGGLLFTAGALLPGGGTIHRTPVSAEDLRLKAAVLRRHGIHGILLRWFLELFLDREQLHRGESYRRVPPRSYLQRPHPGRLGYELYTRFRFADFRAMVERHENDQAPFDRAQGRPTTKSLPPGRRPTRRTPRARGGRVLGIWSSRRSGGGA